MISIALLAALSCAQDWPTFLGPDHNGVSKETGLLKTWPKEGPPLVWKMELGQTYAVPSVVGGAMVLFHRVGDEEIVERVDPATGAKKWRHATGTKYVDRFHYNGGPRAAPAIEGDRVYTLGVEGRLSCLDLETGKPVWTRALHEEYFKDAKQNFFGVGVSPRIDGDAILLNLGDDADGCVTAVDKKSGKTLWRATQDGASYSTATCAPLGGTRVAYFLTREGGVCCNVSDGTVRWTYPFRARDPFSANAASPVVIGDKVFLTASYGVGSALLKVDEKGFTPVWRNRALGAHWGTPIHVDGHLYGFDGRHDYEAQLRCVRLSDGEVIWSKPGYGRGSFILAEGKFILLSEDGRLILADLTSKDCKELASVKVLTKDCWAAPVLSRGLLYVKNFSHATYKATLLCLDLREKK